MMSYENNDRRWMEEQFREIRNRLSEMDKFMGRMAEFENNRNRELSELQKDVQEIKQCNEDTDRKVEGLLSKINKWEAKLGSFMFIAGCLWAFFVAMKDTIMALVKGG